jgi:hypothetical protein
VQNIQPVNTIVYHPPHDVSPPLQIADAYSNFLLASEDYTTAAALSHRLLAGGDTKQKWERWAFMFGQSRHMPDLAPHLPTEGPRLRYVRAYKHAFLMFL